MTEKMSVLDEALEQLALTRAEYALVVERLGREPNEVELGMVGSLWSEHCSYKHSRSLLKMFPSQGERVMVRPGEEIQLQDLTRSEGIWHGNHR